MKRRTRKAPELEDLIMIAEAAKLCAVSQPRLRRWDEIGKLPRVGTRSTPTACTCATT